MKKLLLIFLSFVSVNAYSQCSGVTSTGTSEANSYVSCTDTVKVKSVLNAVTAVNLTVTNTIIGSVNGNANTVTTIPALSGDVTSSGNTTTASGSIVKSVVLNTPNLLYSNPINFVTSGNTATGTLSLNTQTANTILAGPTTGSATNPAFRNLVSADIPALTTLNFATPKNAILKDSAGGVIAAQPGVDFSTQNGRFTESSVQKVRSAFARSATGGTATHIAFYGDSETWGLYQPDPLQTTSYPAQVKQMMINSNVWGNNIFEDIIWFTKYTSAGGGTATVFDTRFTIGSGWTNVNTNGGPGNYSIVNTTTTNSIVFTPTTNNDSYTIWYQIGISQGSFTYSIDGGAPVTVNCNGSAALGKVTSSVTGVGLHTLTITNVTNTTLYAVQQNLSTRPAGGIKISWAGQGGSTTGYWAGAGSVGSTTIAFTNALPDLAVVNLFANDLASNINPSTTYANFNIIIAAAKAVNCDVILMIPANSSTTYTYAYTAYVAVVYQVAREQDLSVIDMSQRWPSRTVAGNAPYSYFADALHPSGKGYNEYATAVFEKLRRIIPSSIPITAAAQASTVIIPESQVIGLATDLAAKQNTITLTTTGGSGAATLIGNILNIPQYTGGGGGSVTTVSVVTANGISGTVANPTNTPAITLSLGAITPSSAVVSGTVQTTGLGIGVTPVAALHIAQAMTAAAWGTSGINLRLVAATYTDNTSSGTVTNNCVNTIGIPTLTASSVTTYTNVPTFYIAGLPVASTNVTITNAYAFWVAAGASRFDGDLLLFSGTRKVGTSDANQLSFITNGSTRVQISSAGLHTYTHAAASSGTTPFFTYTQSINTGGSAGGLLWTAGAHTGQTTATEITDINFNLSAAMALVDGTVSNMRAARIQGRTYNKTTTSATLTKASTFSVTSPVAGTGVTITTNAAIECDGNLLLPTIGNKLIIKEGTNASAGVVTLVAGTATVSNNIVTANSRIKLTAQSLGTISVPVGYAISARSAGTSFTILSGNLTDTSIIYWEIMEPAP